jgi:hypothetical protein
MGKLQFSRSEISELNEVQLARANGALTLLEKRVAELRRIIG